jgi:hypothetical protein
MYVYPVAATGDGVVHGTPHSAVVTHVTP